MHEIASDVSARATKRRTHDQAARTHATRIANYHRAPHILWLVRVLGIDYGARRIGLALSDASATLASPWRAIERPPSERATLDSSRLGDRIAGCVGRRARRRCRRLAAPARRQSDASNRPSSKRWRARSRLAVQLPVVLQDERLSSHEAESRLARREPDWRKRKSQARCRGRRRRASGLSRWPDASRDESPA